MAGMILLDISEYSTPSNIYDHVQEQVKFAIENGSKHSHPLRIFNITQLTLSLRMIRYVRNRRTTWWEFK